MRKYASKITTLFILILGSVINVCAQGVEQTEISSILEVEQYGRAIHIMAMLLIGFGFLMVFVKKYGRSALTATFLLVSISSPAYIAIKSLGIFEEKGEIE